MIKVEKYTNEMGEQLRLIFENGNVININFAANLDLYFTPWSKEYQKDYTFEIDNIDDYDLYKIFNDLFQKVVHYRNLDGNVDESFKKNDKRSDNPLVKDNVITWISDDDPTSIASRLSIYKTKNKICLDFKEGRHEEGFIAKPIRFRTSGSRYGYFYIPFIELYGNICSKDFSTHQYSLDEYLLALRRKKK